MSAVRRTESRSDDQIGSPRPQETADAVASEDRRATAARRPPELCPAPHDRAEQPVSHLNQPRPPRDRSFRCPAPSLVRDPVHKSLDESTTIYQPATGMSSPGNWRP